MKILFLVHQFYPEFQSGTEKFVFNNALMAQTSGHKVKVITYSFHDDSYFDHYDDGIFSKEFFYQGIPVLAFKYKNPQIDLHLSLENNMLSSFAKKIYQVESPDIIHVGHSMRVHEFVRVAIREKIPYVLTLTDFFLICPKVILAPKNNSLCSGPQHGSACRVLCSEFSEGFIGKRLTIAKEILLNAKQIVSPSKFVARIFIQEINELDIKIIGHGIRYNHIKENKRIYHGGEKLIFGYAGTIAYHKGVHVLVEAFKRIDNENAELKIFGSGDERYIKFLKEIAGKSDKVSFCGTFSSVQVGEVLNGLDVLVIPSVCYESYSLILHEALASNVPAIVSALGGMLEKINDGITGFTFEPGSSVDLLNKINLILANPQILNELKENITNKMVVPTIEQEAYKYNAIYSSYRVNNG